MSSYYKECALWYSGMLFLKKLEAYLEPCLHLRWSILRKKFMAFNGQLFSQRTLSWMLNMVLNKPLHSLNHKPTNSDKQCIKDSIQ